jgi:hypothetical protein
MWLEGVCTIHWNALKAYGDVSQLRSLLLLGSGLLSTEYLRGPQFLYCVSVGTCGCKVKRRLSVIGSPSGSVE